MSRRFMVDAGSGGEQREKKKKKRMKRGKRATVDKKPFRQRRLGKKKLRQREWAGGGRSRGSGY